MNRLLVSLHDHGVDEAVICAYGDAEPLKNAVRDIDTMRLSFLDEPFPVGNAGCIRDAWDGDRDTVFLVLHAAMMSLPDVASLLEAHRRNGSHLTVMLGPDGCGGLLAGRTPELYVCGPAIIDYIPPQGYFDMKEGLIPALVRVGEKAAADVLPRSTCRFRDRPTYLSALGHWLTADAATALASAGLACPSQDLWIGPGAQLAPDVTACGPVVVMDGARIGPGVVMFGPTVVESGAVVGPGTVLDNCVLWPGAVVGARCHITAGIIGYDARLPDDAVVEDDVVLQKNTGRSPVRPVKRLTRKKIIVHDELEVNVGRP